MSRNNDEARRFARVLFQPGEKITLAEYVDRQCAFWEEPWVPPGRARKACEEEKDRRLVELGKMFAESPPW